jgi:hypothetical protein
MSVTDFLGFFALRFLFLFFFDIRGNHFTWSLKLLNINEDRLRQIVDEAITNNVMIQSHDVMLKSHGVLLESHDATLKSHDATLKSHDILLKEQSESIKDLKFNHRKFQYSLDTLFSLVHRQGILAENTNSKIDTMLEILGATVTKCEAISPIIVKLEDFEPRLRAVEYTLTDHLTSKNPHK